MTSHSEKHSAIAFERHNHGACVRSGLTDVEALCAREGLRLTPVRRKTLEVLLQDHRALGAYEVLDRLRDAGFGSQPPVAYRALDFLVSHGFVHKVECLNAFVACADPKAAHSPAFMICRVCASVAEAMTPTAKGALGDAARAAGFRIECTVLEAEGLCPACAKEEAA